MGTLSLSSSNIVPKHEGWVQSVALSPDNTQVMTGGSDGTIRLWDLETAKELRRYNSRGRAKAPLKKVGFFLDGIHGFASSWGETRYRTVHATWIFNLETGEELQVFAEDAPVLHSALSPDSHYLVACLGVGIVKLWDTQSGENLLDLQNMYGAKVAFLPDNDRFLMVMPEQLSLWDIQAGQLIYRHSSDIPSRSSLPPKYPDDIACSSDGAYAAVSRRGIEVFEVDTGKPVQVLPVKGGPIRSIVFLYDTHYLVGVGEDRIIFIWNVATGKLESKIHAHSHIILDVACSLDNRLLVTGSADGTAQVWDIQM
ncbi:MAG: WD40 repeat domain-containing protein [Anaerolineae bacterium]|nr:WD40 repeat domain-containing protein [Anaerolineae bacterium]